MKEYEMSLPVRLENVGQFFAQPGWTHEHRVLKNTTLILTESGCFTVVVGGEELTIGPNEMVVFPEGVEHYGVARSTDVPPVYYWAHVIQPAGTRQNALRVPTRRRDLSQADLNKLCAVFSMLNSEHKVRAQGDPVCDYLASTLLAMLAEQQEPDPAEALYHRMVEYIRNHYREPLTLATLSREFGYCEDHLSRVFRSQHPGVTFRGYIHRLRIQQAQRELLSSTRTIR